MIRFAEPFLWDQQDDEPVDLALMLILPQDRWKEHHGVLVRLYRRVADIDFLKALRAAPDEAAVVALVAEALAG
jgi:mannitol/fructose-specific phosphotransferase system IIA component (Ntr-type)